MSMGPWKEAILLEDTTLRTVPVHSLIGLTVLVRTQVTHLTRFSLISQANQKVIEAGEIWSLRPSHAISAFQTALTASDM
jgi:hypothetical protein